MAAAEKAPTVFNIAAYFRPIYLMRQKGNSWRELEKWVREFGIEVSAVHLRRLYVHENERLSALSAQELAEQGCPAKMIDELLKKQDPTGRLTALDPEDTALVAKRRKMLQDAGVSDDEIHDVDLDGPVTVDGKTL